MSKLSLSCGGGNAGWTRSHALRPPTECSVPISASHLPRWIRSGTRLG